MQKTLKHSQTWLRELSGPKTLQHNFTDVTIVCNDGSRYFAHSVVLSLSSVLRGCLAVVDVRVSRDITVFIDYDHEVVEAFLTFLYKGQADVDKAIRKDFFELCSCLRWNPTVSIHEEELTASPPNDDVAQNLPGSHQQNIVNTTNQDVNVNCDKKRKESLNSSSSSSRSQSRSSHDSHHSSGSSPSPDDSEVSADSGDKESVATPTTEETSAPTGNGFEEVISSKPSLDKKASSSFSDHGSSGPDKKCGKITVRSDPFQNIRKAGFLNKSDHIKDRGKAQNSESSGPGTEEETLNREPEIPMTCDICFKIYVGSEALGRHKLSDHENDENKRLEDSGISCPVQPSSEEKVAAPQNDESDLANICPMEVDEETPENISDYLHKLNKEAEDKEDSSSESDDDIIDRDERMKMLDLEVGAIFDNKEEKEPSEEEESTTKEFKMPESYDIPQDYIREIVPTFKRSSNSPDISSASPMLHPSTSPDHITYYSKDDSSRVSKGTRRHPSGDAKWNRRKTQYHDLFGDEGSQDSGDLCTVPIAPGSIPTVRKEFTTCGGTASILGQSQPAREEDGEQGAGDSDVESKRQSNTGDAGLLINELQDKKERIKRKLLDSDQEEVVSYKEKRKKKKKKSSRSTGSERASSYSRSSSVSGSSKLESQPGGGKSRDRVSAEATGASHERGKSTPSKVCRPGSEGGRVPFKFEDDNDWLVSDSHEDSSEYERRRRKEKKRKKRKKKKMRLQRSGLRLGEQEDDDDDEEEEEDERRKRLDARKERKGGDVLAWMSRRPRINVKFWAEGKETIIEKSIYKMNLLGAEDSSSSSESPPRNRSRHSSTSSEGNARDSNEPPCRKPHGASTKTSHTKETNKKKSEKNKKKKIRKKHLSSSSDSQHQSTSLSRSTASNSRHIGSTAYKSEKKGDGKGSNNGSADSYRDNWGADTKKSNLTPFKRSVSMTDKVKTFADKFSGGSGGGGTNQQGNFLTSPHQPPTFHRSVSHFGSFKIPKLTTTTTATTNAGAPANTLSSSKPNTSGD
eukprot:TRINITY_DN2342_c0_g1_i13.p1 TRINITY_DN2342_c0_g1~~TRINITY_DN2342_c0_g1_i13.p1  ORF type:complete len:1027 (-),score=273.71 TRINITY_DN2342_c0_g1_i13:419-3499(-)